MRDTIIKIGAYTILIFGEIVALLLLVFSIFIFLYYPDTSFEKKAIVGAFFLILSLVFAIFALALFESMLELIHIDQEFEELIKKK